MKFEISHKQALKIQKWEKAIALQVVEQQKSTLKNWEDLTMNGKYPYYGAIGGGLTYSFTPTALGTIVKVTHNYTNETLDVTDYAEW
jgi:hypothetical protein